MYKIAIIGTGYVGLVTGACLADFGLDVTCFDIDKEKIKLLNSGKMTIYEPELEIIVGKNISTNRLCFTHDLQYAIKNATVIFIAVGTPPREDGTPDLSYLQNAVESITPFIDAYKVVVTKSTVPVGSCRLVKKWLNDAIKAQTHYQGHVDVISNPEFLREGSAVYDFTHPDRIIIGFETTKSLSIIKSVYRVLYLNEIPFIETNFETAEMIKYASNAFLALKITYINQIANLCEKVGANVLDVAKAMGKDGRIGSKFLHPGPGYGGSCFPKDVSALCALSQEVKSPVTVLQEVIKANEAQKERMTKKIMNALGTLSNKRIAVLGLSFKPNTDDLRESPAVYIVSALRNNGALVKIFDPVAMAQGKKLFAEGVSFHDNEYDAIRDSDAVVIVTEWNQFRNLDLIRIKKILRTPYFFDLRNIYRKEYVEETGLHYFGVGV